MNHPGLPDLPAYHRRLLVDILGLGRPCGLALMGGYAVRAHGIVHRPGQVLDFATTRPTALPQIAGHLAQGLGARGWRVSALHAAPVTARFLATGPDSGQSCEVDFLKGVLWRPPVVLGLGPVIALEDLIGTTVRALADRGLPRDVMDVYAASGQFSRGELERCRTASFVSESHGRCGMDVGSDTAVRHRGSSASTGRRHSPADFPFRRLHRQNSSTRWSCSKPAPRDPTSSIASAVRGSFRRARP